MSRKKFKNEKKEKELTREEMKNIRGGADSGAEDSAPPPIPNYRGKNYQQYGRRIF